MKQHHVDNPSTRLKISASLQGRKFSSVSIDRMREAQRKRVLNGTHHGWPSRKVESYPEKFWRTVLENNRIPYQQEVPIAGYFLDFVVQKSIDVEIDGGFHSLPERRISDNRRDQVLHDLGFTVYRIPWINPYNEEQSLKVKKQVEDLILFLKGC